MKYNDKASKQFHQRSIDSNNNFANFYGEQTERKERRINQMRYEADMKNTIKHPLCEVMSNSEKHDLYEHFKYHTNGSWGTYRSNYTTFCGSFTEFIDLLEKEGDERIVRLRIKLRNHNIHALIGE